MKKKTLILGAHGNLGTQLHTLLPDAAAWDHGDVDATNFGALGEKVNAYRPDVIINCIAYNDVDGAESHESLAVLLNGDLPAELSRIANSIGALLVHVSTGYVFGGTKNSYTESDAPAPVNTYGRTKLAGEQQVQLICQKFYIVRTNVLFGRAGTSASSKKSFVDIMLGLTEKHQVVRAVSDEVNSVTYTPDLAQQIVALAESGKPYGIYHITNSGHASWLEFAQEIFKVRGLGIEVVPVPSSEFVRPAIRPRRAVLENTKLPQMRTWQNALQEYLTRTDRAN